MYSTKCFLFEKSNFLIRKYFQTYPLVFVMMTRKTQICYEHALKYIHENVFPLRCKAMITDFELAMRQALRNILPGIILLGCWFHYTQAIRRKVASIEDLFEIVRKVDTARNLYCKFLCLALLPHDLIEKAFNELALEALQSHKAWTSFIKYYQAQWLKRTGPKNFSVFLEETRTTCSAEGYNGKLGRTFRTHPNFLVFIESLQWEELSKSNALEQHISGARQTQPKKMYRERATRIREESMKFTIPNQTNAKLFLNRIANFKNNLIPNEFESFENIVKYSNDAEEILDSMNKDEDTIIETVEKDGAKKVTTIGTVKRSKKIQSPRQESNVSDNGKPTRPLTRSQVKKNLNV